MAPPIIVIVSQNDYNSKADFLNSRGKNRHAATNFQFLKILAPLGQLLVGACLPQTLLVFTEAQGLTPKFQPT